MRKKVFIIISFILMVWVLRDIQEVILAVLIGFNLHVFFALRKIEYAFRIVGEELEKIKS